MHFWFSKNSSTKWFKIIFLSFHIKTKILFLNMMQFFKENEIFLNSRKKLGKISTHCRQNPKMSEGLEDRRSLFMLLIQMIQNDLKNQEKFFLVFLMKIFSKENHYLSSPINMIYQRLNQFQLFVKSYIWILSRIENGFVKQPVQLMVMDFMKALIGLQRN